MRVVHLLFVYLFVCCCVCLELFVVEEQPAGTSLGRPITSGRDFSLTSENAYFEIDANSSEIRTRIRLDRDLLTYNNVSLRIQWYPLNLDGTVSYTSVEVLILDINDNAPSFPAAGETVLFLESSAVGSNSRLSQATDPDKGSNGSVSYSLTTGTEEGMPLEDIPFELNLTRLPAVFLRVKSELDYESKHIYKLLLTATDGGANPLSTLNSIIVQVQDENDQSPAFLSSNYSFNIPENSDDGAYLGRVEAVDTDSGLGGKVLYSVVEENIPFSVAMDGLITVSGRIDYETKAEFQFQIEASNSIPVVPALAPNSSSVLVFVQVSDENDNTPYFLFREGQDVLGYTWEEEISCPAFQSLTCVTITQLIRTPNRKCLLEVGLVGDRDTGVNGEVSDVLLGSLGRLYFTPIICNSLRLMTRRAVFILQHGRLDREKQPEFSFNLSLFDGGAPKLRRDWLLYLVLTDINDNPPTFSEQNYGISLAENITTGTHILTVSATDPDFGVNGIVRYNITQFSPSSAQLYIAMDARTGMLSTTGPLDRETIGAEILLKVSATDTSPTPLSHSAGVTILLTDVNDNAPLFEMSNYSLSLSENQPLHTSLFTFLASDSDAGFAGEVRYSVNENSLISIDPSNGTVRLESELDYESADSHTFYITASDLAIPVLSSRVTFTIRVTDYNDNPPLFTPSSLTGSVSEDAAIGSSVLQISASDADTGSNAFITYHLDTISHLFELSESGLLQTIQTLDRERTPIYTLSVTARNSAAANQLSAAALLSVTVTDVDDTAPELQFSRLILHPLANQIGDALVAPSLVTDQDTNTLQCSVPDQSNRFFLTSPTPGLCHLHATLPHLDGMFTLPILAQDTQNSIQSELNVEITSLTDVTINNSLVIEVSNSSQTQFLNGMYDVLLSAIPVPSQLHIWSFAPSPINQSNLWVLISARSEESGEIMTPNELSRAIATSLPLLTPHIHVANHKVSLCVNHTCVNGDCVDVIQAQSNSPYFLTNTSHLILAPKFNISPVCVCYQGYTGGMCEREINLCLDLAPCLNMGWCVNNVTNGYVCYCQQLFTGRRCETALNICSSSPCMNSGNCVELGDTFKCECPPGYTGERCEFYLGFCPSSGVNPCRNGGRCVDGPTGFTCDCSSWFVGEICQTSVVCFQLASYLQYGTNTLTNLTTSPTRRADIEIALQMKTTQHSGLLIYLQEDTAFLILEIINSSLHYLARSEARADSSDFVEIYPTLNVADDMWHSVTLKSSIHSGFASLTIDGREPLSGAQTDSLDQLGLDRQSNLATAIQLSSVTMPLTVGGLPTYVPDFRFLPHGNLNIALSGTNTYANFLLRNHSLLDYKGAIRNLSVNGELVSVPIATSRQVVPSSGGSGECERDNSCSADTSCSGHGRCVPLCTDHFCVCHLGHSGRDCQIPTIPVSLSGKGAIWLELSNLTLETHLKTHADWSVVRRILDTESELGMRQLSLSERELQIEFFGRELQPRQSVEVSFRTRTEHGLILTTSDDENYSILEVSDGLLRFRLGRHIQTLATHFDTFLPYAVTNGSQFMVSITLTREGLTIVIISEEGNATHWLASANQITWLEAGAPISMVLGGKHDSILSTLTSSSQNFTGCLSGVRVSGIELPLHRPIRELGVTSQLIGEVVERCDQYGTCYPDSCPSATKCVPVWTGIRCECELGKEYSTETERCEEVDDCVQAADTKCHNGGHCLDGVNSFTCSCTPLYTGVTCREINLTILLIILVMLVLLIALIILPFALWLLFRLCSHSSEGAYYARHKSSIVNNIPPLHTSTPNPLTGLSTHSSHLWDSFKSGVKAKFRTDSHDFQSITPPLANYPPANQVTEFTTPLPNNYSAEPSVFIFPEVRKAKTFPSTKTPSRYHGNTMPLSHIPMAYSPPLANPFISQHSNPNGKSLRKVHISDQFV